jgi:spore germination protein GerM
MGSNKMSVQKKIILGLLILWVVLLIVFGLVRSGLLIHGKIGVYFFQKQSGDFLTLVPVERKTKGMITDVSDKIRYAIEQLISGPAPEEAEEFISCVPTETKLLDVRIDGDLIYVDFDETVETGGGIEEIRGRLAQIVFTATQFNPDAGVILLINGKEIKSFSGEGITEVEKPMHRNEFLDFVKEEKE